MNKLSKQAAFWVLIPACGLSHADLLGVNYSTGDVFSISTTDASATRIGQTSTGIMGLDRDQTGRVVAITDGVVGKSAVLSEHDWQLDPIGNIGAGFTFEGGLAIGDTGEIYGGSRLAGGARAIFEIDPATGGMARSVSLSRPVVDLNGLLFRDDGVLVAIDAAGGDYVTIDPLTGEMVSVAALITPSPGAVGGLAIESGIGYYVTAGGASGSDGDNSLYSIDLHTGEQRFIGALGSEAGAGFGIGALVGSSVPTPGVMLTMGGASLVASRRRLRR